MRFAFLFLTSPLFAQLGPVLLGFEPNVGQYPPKVLFVRTNQDNRMYLTRDTVVNRFGVRIQMVDIDPAASPVPDTVSAGQFNFYQGKDSSAWRNNALMY